MGNQKLNENDKDFIIELAEKGKSLSQIKKQLKDERNVELGSRQTIANVIKNAGKPKNDIKGECEKFTNDDTPAEPRDANQETQSVTNSRAKFSIAKLAPPTIKLYDEFLKFCEEQSVSMDIARTLYIHATRKRKCWRRIIMDTIDVLRVMGYIK